VLRHAWLSLTAECIGQFNYSVLRASLRNDEEINIADNWYKDFKSTQCYETGRINRPETPSFSRPHGNAPDCLSFDASRVWCVTTRLNSAVAWHDWQLIKGASPCTGATDEIIGHSTIRNELGTARSVAQPHGVKIPITCNFCERITCFND
jgi:hypothetical protein